MKWISTKYNMQVPYTKVNGFQDFSHEVPQPPGGCGMGPLFSKNSQKFQIFLSQVLEYMVLHVDTLGAAVDKMFFIPGPMVHWMGQLESKLLASSQNCSHDFNERHGDTFV